MTNKLYSISDVAAKLGVKASKVYDLIRTHVLTDFFVVGKKTRVFNDQQIQDVKKLLKGKK